MRERRSDYSLSLAECNIIEAFASYLSQSTPTISFVSSTEGKMRSQISENFDLFVQYFFLVPMSLDMSH